jgi:hypothetical protein
VTPFVTTEKRPFEFCGKSIIDIWLTRTFTDGKKERAKLVIEIYPHFMTDGASTFWPVSLLVPQWRKGDDDYNAAPTAHDVLYILKGIVEGDHEPVKLSREEVDDILRGMWRCWGMSRFVAGCADKGVEIFAGGKNHWGNDSYGVGKYARAKWEVID